MKSLYPILAILILTGVALASDGGTNPICRSTAGSHGVIVSKVANPRVPAGTDETDTTVLFSESFENQPSGWTSQDMTDIGPQWHPSPFNAFSGNSWWCGDSTFYHGATVYTGYYNCWLQYLISPTLDLQGITNAQLTFRVRWAVEPPGVSGPYTGYDGCNVWISTDNGSHWSVLNPVSPAYNCTSLKSFGAVFGFGPNIPGWVDSTSGVNWQRATFDLSAYQVSNVKIRWAFCSDGAVCSFLHPGLTGYFVDNILVNSAGDTLLWNDADGGQIGGPLTTAAGPGMGDYWALSTLSSHSPTHSERVDNDHYYLNDMLISPPIAIPYGVSTRFSYWVLCDLPDSTHPSSPNPNMLRDFYVVWARVVGQPWDTLFYDYARWGSPDWAQMVPGIPYNGNMDMDLSAYAGHTIQLGWEVILDGDDTQGHGQGLFIDDVEVFSTPGLTNDVGIKYLHIPFPTVNGFTGTATISNFGTNANSFIALWRTNEEVHSFGPLPPWSLPPLRDSTVSISFDTTAGETIFVDAYTIMPGDLNPTNDTCKAGAIEIFPVGDWVTEYGYDARGYSYLDTLLSLHYPQGSGPMVHFLQSGPQGWGWYRAMFWQTGSFTAHFYNGDSSQIIGSEMGTITVQVGAEETYPHWKIFENTVYDMGYRWIPFWIWFEMTQPGGGPDLVGDVQHYGQGHYFDYDGVTLTPSEHETYMRAIGNSAIGVLPTPDPAVLLAYTLESPRPNPFNPATSITFDLPGSGEVSLTAYDLSGRQVAMISAGPYSAGRHEVVWNAGGMSSGLYLLRLESAFGVQVKKAVLIK